MRRVTLKTRTRKARQVREIILRWRRRLLLEDWSFCITISPKPNRREPDNYLASINVSERYRSGDVLVYPVLDSLPPPELERTLVHELMHAPLNRVANLLNRLIPAGLATKEDADTALESLTEHLTNIVWDAYEGRR